MQRHVDDVVAVLRRQTGHVGLHGELRPGDADHAEPLLVHLDEPADRILGPEERGGRRLAEHGDGGGRVVVPRCRRTGPTRRAAPTARRTPAPRRTPPASRPAASAAAWTGVIRLRALIAREAADVRLDHAQVLERQARRQLPDLLQRLPIGRLARLDDDVAHAQLLDERNHLLPRAGADRQHRHDRRHAEDHAEHRQQRAQLVRAQVVEPLVQLGHEVEHGRAGPAERRAAMRGHRTGPPPAGGRWRRRAARPSRDSPAPPRCLRRCRRGPRGSRSGASP